MISLRRILGSALLALVSLTGLAQPRTVVLSGYVRDAESGEPLPQAVVFLEDRKTGVAADDVGFYSLHVPAGKQPARRIWKWVSVALYGRRI